MIENKPKSGKSQGGSKKRLEAIHIKPLDFTPHDEQFYQQWKINYHNLYCLNIHKRNLPALLHQAVP